MNRLSAAALLGLCVLAGCSGKNDGGGPPLAKVSGTVNLDGGPMQGGEVRFSVPGQPAKVLEVKGGSFSGEVHSGKNRVEVLWEKDAPNPMDPKGPPMKVNTISDKYSGPNSSLNEDVPAGGKDGLKFDVKSVGKR